MSFSPNDPPGGSSAAGQRFWMLDVDVFQKKGSNFFIAQHVKEHVLALL